MTVDSYIASVDLSALSPRQRARFELEADRQQRFTDEAKEELARSSYGAALMRDEPMANHTRLGVGGPADMLLEVERAEDLEEARAFAAERKIPCVVLENGDVIVRDKGVRGLVIMMKAAGDNAGAGTLVEVFRHEGGAMPAQLIAEAGLQGVRVGRIRVGGDDANSLINEGGASAADALVLISMVKDRVKASSGVALELAVKIVGER